MATETVEVSQEAVTRALAESLAGQEWVIGTHEQLSICAFKTKLAVHYGLTLDHTIMINVSQTGREFSLTFLMDVNSKWTRIPTAAIVNDLHVMCPIPGNLSVLQDEAGHPFLRHLHFNYLQTLEDTSVEEICEMALSTVDYCLEMRELVLKIIRGWFTGPISIETARAMSGGELALYTTAGEC